MVLPSPPGIDNVAWAACILPETCSWCASCSHPHWIASTVYAVGHTSSALVHISIERLRSRRRRLDSRLNDMDILLRSAQGFEIRRR